MPDSSDAPMPTHSQEPDVAADTTAANDDSAVAEPDTTVASEAAAAPADAPANDQIDLDAIERDLDDVQAALQRLADGTYWTDEVSGEPLDEALLATSPLVRRK